jgi:hypothetical protein
METVKIKAKIHKYIDCVFEIISKSILKFKLAKIDILLRAFKSFCIENLLCRSGQLRWGHGRLKKNCA